MVFERFSPRWPIPLHSADGGEGSECGAGQDAPPASCPPPLPADLLGGLGICRNRVPPAARGRRRGPGLGLNSPRRLDQPAQRLLRVSTVERRASQGDRLSPVVGLAG